MSMPTRGAATALMCALVCTAPAREARADSFVVPFVAVNFGGSTGNTFNVEDAGDPKQRAFGLSMGYMSGGVFGMELDVAYARHFFGDGPSVEGNSLLTVMPAVVFGIPVGGQQGGGVRPYGLAGIGMTRRDLSVDDVELFEDTNLAYSLGAGIFFYFTDNVGVNAEYRYLRNVFVDEVSIAGVDVDRGTFSFSRASFGVAFRF